MREKIITFIEQNNLSTSDVADVLGRTGLLEGINPIKMGHCAVGEAVFIYARNDSNWQIHKTLETLDCTNKIIFVDGIQCDPKLALLGGLVSAYAFKKKAKAIVCNGKIRDLGEILQKNYKIWCKGYTPIVTTKFETKEIDVPNQMDGSILVCDECGVVQIPNDKITEDTLEKLKQVKQKEIDWFDKLEKGLSTFQITCKK